MTPRPPLNPALSPGNVYREAFRLMADPDVTQEQAEDWHAREAAMMVQHGADVAELAYRKEAQEQEDATGLCVICGKARHDQEDF